MSLANELEAVWTALAADDLDEAFARLRRLPDDLPERHMAEACAWMGRGDLLRAEAVLARGADVPGVAEDYLWALAELRLLQWRPADAWRALERLAPRFRDHLASLDPSFLDRLVLAAELMGHFDEADELLATAHAAAPADHPLPLRLSAEEFDRVVRLAVERLPEPFLGEVLSISIVIDPVPTERVVGGAGSGHPPDILGLFVGANRLERSVDSSAELPPMIYLFQRNIERACRDRDELVEEIHTTLYHELGHALGFDEDGLAAIGLE